MKKIFFSLIFTATALIFLSNKSIAQFSLGVKGGISIPNLTAGGNNPVSSGWSSRLGPYFGLVGEYSLSNHFDLQAQLNYSSQGGKKNGEQAIPNPFGGSPQYVYANYNSIVRLNYVELPLLAKLNFSLGKRMSFFIDAGPYAGFMIGAKQISNGSSYFYLDEAETEQSPYPPTPQSFDTTVDIKNQVNKFNAGIQGGIGLELKAGNGKLFFAAGGNYGFINIQKYSQDGKNNTGAARIALGYLIKL